MFFVTTSIAQVGIGTTTPYSSLDIVIADPGNPSNKDGILVPRLDQLPAIDPKDDQNGMLVYLTTADGAYPIGFTYWDKTLGVAGEWVSLVQNDWKLTGNDNAVSGTHFLGTTNTEEVDFRVNRKHIARFTEKGQFELEADEKSILIGYQAGENYDPANTAAEQNVFIGYHAAMNSTSGRDNVAIGAFSMSLNTTGSFNTAIGDETMERNETGNNNSAFGNDALRYTDDGDNNTAVGQSSLRVNEDGDNNTAIGMQALDSNKGDNNTAIGYSAGEANATGENNTFIGYNADATATNLSNVVVIGANASVSSDDTIAIGSGTLAQAAESIAIGKGTSVQGTAVQATAIGYNALIDGNAATSMLFGNNSTINNGATNSLALGNNIALAGGVTNVVALGNGITINNGKTNATGVGYQASPTMSNQVRLGNTAITNIMGQVAMTTTSDARFKTDVQEDILGLDFIKELTPVSYVFNKEALSTHLGETEIAKNTGEREVGFLAQQVEKVAKDLGFDFSGIKAPDGADDIYGLRYASFVVPLVKAVQEQQDQIEALQKEIAAIKHILSKDHD